MAKREMTTLVPGVSKSTSLAIWVLLAGRDEYQDHAFRAETTGFILELWLVTSWWR